MMATNDEAVPERDYSQPSPIPTVSYDSTHPGPAAGSGNERIGRRRGSFTAGFSSFLRRSSSRPAESRRTVSNDIPAAEVPPPLPRTYNPLAQVDTDPAAATAAMGTSSTVTSGTINRNEGRTMLRKASALRKEKEKQAQAEEAERQARMNRPAPRLPQTAPIPAMGSFGGENALATYTTTTTQSSHQPLTSANSLPNFSRPATKDSHYQQQHHHMSTNSSSPAYAVRSGNALAAAASSSPDAGGSGTQHANGEYVYSPVHRPDSMANRARYSYAPSATGVDPSSPRRIRRRKDPTPFNVLVIGTKNSGKTSLITFLRHSLALASYNGALSQPNSTITASKSSFASHYLETEMDGERVGLTLWDSEGLEMDIIDLQLREMVAFVEAKFEETFVEEQKVNRSPGVKDSHIHCVLLVLDPVRLDATVAASKKANGGAAGGQDRNGLNDELDLQVMRALSSKTTVIPVIAKADTLTAGHMSFLKSAVWESIKRAKLDPLEALELEDDVAEDDDDEDKSEGGGDSPIDPEMPFTRAKKSHNRQASITRSVKSGGTDDDTPYIPMSVLSPDPYDFPPDSTHSARSAGRVFPWGVADPLNPAHCDFPRLRDSIFTEWRTELRDLVRSKYYEAWRTARLKNLPGARQRVRGGVTPVAAVPREGRTVSPLLNRSKPVPASNTQGATAAATVPRSVSGSAAATAATAKTYDRSAVHTVDYGPATTRG